MSILEILEHIQEEDTKFIKEKLKTTAATYCCECHRNTPIGLYPFWHKFRRSLCTKCGEDYKKLLKALGADSILE